MKLVLISAALPPLVDGIGDYTANMARHLTGRAEVLVLTTADQAVDPIDGVRVIPAFSPTRRRTVRKLAPILEAERPDWVVLQFNQFSYGQWGLNPVLPGVMRRIRATCPATKIAVMFHENFVPPTSWKFRIMRLWQKWQFIQLGRSAHLVFFSIDPWVKQYRGWFGKKPVLHLPVGSNIPRVDIGRAEARARLGIEPGQLVLGVFGSLHEGRNLPWLRAALDAVRAHGPGVVLLYIGADHAKARELAGDLPVIAAGPLDGNEVSRRLSAVDVYLSAFSDGVSTRRGSFMAAIQHGLATIATKAEATDEILQQHNGQAFVLTDAGHPDEFGLAVTELLEKAELRRWLGERAKCLYDGQFAWDCISHKLIEHLYATADPAAPTEGVGRAAVGGNI